MRKVNCRCRQKTVELLNAIHEGTFVPAHPLDESTKQCKECHTKGSTLEDARGKMACWSCHSDKGATHIEQIKIHPKI